MNTRYARHVNKLHARRNITDESLITKTNGKIRIII